MTQLSAYINSIIQVVNQHAKLLDNVSYELNMRPRKLEIGDMFHILSTSFPYDKVCSKYGFNPDTPQPRSIFIHE